MKFDPFSLASSPPPEGTPRHLLVFDAAWLLANGVNLSTREWGERFHLSHVTASKIVKEAKAVVPVVSQLLEA